MPVIWVRTRSPATLKATKLLSDGQKHCRRRRCRVIPVCAEIRSRDCSLSIGRSKEHFSAKEIGLKGIGTRPPHIGCYDLLGLISLPDPPASLRSRAQGPSKRVPKHPRQPERSIPTLRRGFIPPKSWDTTDFYGGWHLWLPHEKGLSEKWKAKIMSLKTAHYFIQIQCLMGVITCHFSEKPAGLRAAFNCVAFLKCINNEHYVKICSKTRIFIQNPIEKKTLLAI